MTYIFLILENTIGPSRLLRNSKKLRNDLSSLYLLTGRDTHKVDTRATREIKEITESLQRHKLNSPVFQ